MIDILDYRTIGKNKDGSVTLINTHYDDVNERDISNSTTLVNDHGMIAVLIRKINELTDRINDFHGINE